MLLIPALAFAQSQKITLNFDEKSFQAGQIAELKGNVDPSLAGKPVAVEVKDSQGQIILLRTVQPDANGNFVLKFKVPVTARGSELQISTSVESERETISESSKVQVSTTEPQSKTSKPVCGAGTILENGICVPDKLILNKIHNLKLQKGQWAKYDLSYYYKTSNSILKDMETQFSLSHGIIPFGDNYDPSLYKTKLFKIEISDVTNSYFKMKGYAVQTDGSEKQLKELIISDLSDQPFVINPDVKIGDKLLKNDQEFIVKEFTKLNVGNKEIDVIKTTLDKIISKEGYYLEIKVTAMYHRNTGMLLLWAGHMNGNFGVDYIDAKSTFNAVDVSDHFLQKPFISSQNGCLIATAAYGTELAPQVQLLREVRDNVLLSTSSGTRFMNMFDSIYYSFSPTVADWERQNPVFREMVKATITPMLSTLSILNYVDVNSEQQMLGYGIGVILLNIGMYFVIPAIVIIQIKQKFKKS
jgi:hypothetical protein